MRELDWRRESVFAVPLNMAFTLRNTGDEPARLALINNAHLMMDLLGAPAPPFACDLSFPEREEPVLDATSRRGCTRSAGAPPTAARSSTTSPACRCPSTRSSAVPGSATSSSS